MNFIIISKRAIIINLIYNDYNNKRNGTYNLQFNCLIIIIIIIVNYNL